jgi:hypothetical protein
MSDSGQMLLGVTLLAVIAAGACAGSSTTGPTSASHRYSIDLAADLVGGNLCQWSYEDHGSLVVTMSGDEGTVSDIINTEATLTMNPCNSTCTEELVNRPRGPIDIFEVTGVAENQLDGMVVVSYNSRAESPQFRDTCAGEVTTVGGATATLPTAFTFKDDGTTQNADVNDPVTGQSIHMSVTPLT